MRTNPLTSTTVSARRSFRLVIVGTRVIGVVAVADGAMSDPQYVVAQ